MFRKKIRNAEIKDLDFLCAIYLETAKKGHFILQEKVVIEGFYKQIIEKGYIVRLAASESSGGRRECVNAQLTIFETKGVPVGFLLCSNESHERPDSVELYQIAVLDKNNRQGIATSLINDGLNRNKHATSFYARCFASSSAAVSLFLKLGFKIEKVSPQLMHYLRRINTSCPRT